MKKQHTPSLKGKHPGAAGGPTMKFQDGGEVLKPPRKKSTPFLNPPAGETVLRDPRAQENEALARPGFLTEAIMVEGPGGGKIWKPPTRLFHPGEAAKVVSTPLTKELAGEYVRIKGPALTQGSAVARPPLANKYGVERTAEMPRHRVEGELSPAGRGRVQWVEGEFLSGPEKGQSMLLHSKELAHGEQRNLLNKTPWPRETGPNPRSTQRPTSEAQSFRAPASYRGNRRTSGWAPRYLQEP